MFVSHTFLHVLTYHIDFVLFRGILTYVSLGVVVNNIFLVFVFTVIIILTSDLDTVLIFPATSIPDIYISKESARIMSLQDPTKKMSQSDENPNAYISMVEEDDVISSKIKKAVTDSIGKIAYNDEQVALKNLINIYCAYSNKTPDEVVRDYDGKNYGQFKADLTQVVIEGIRPVRERYKELINNKDHLEKIYKKGAEEARYSARKMIRKVYRKIGFVENE